MKANLDGTISATRPTDARTGNLTDRLLLNSDEWARKLFELNNAAMLIINPTTGKIVAANQASAALYGWSIAELEQMRIQQINTLETDDVTEKMQQARQTGGGTFEFRHRIADGTLKTVEVFSSRIELNGEDFLFSIIMDITNRKLVEADKNRQAGLITSLLDSSHDIVFFKDTTGVFLGGNQQFAELLGVEQDEIAGKTDYDFFGAAIAKKFREQDLQVINQQLSMHNDVEVAYPDGRKVLVDTLKTPYRDSTGKLVGILGVSRDITERKLIENKLRDSETNFRTFFETIDDIIVIGDSQGTIFFANGAARSKLGYTMEELLGKHVLELHPSEKQVEAQQIFADMFAGLRRSCPLPLVRKDGTLIPVETRVWFGKWDDKECIFGISKDLSQQQAAYDMFHKLFDNNPALMAVSSIPDRKFVEVNAAFLDKLGYSKEEIIGKTSKELELFAENAEFLAVADKLQKERQTRDIELAVRRKDGQIINGLFSAEIIDNQLEKSFLTVMTDITAIRQAEKAQKLAESELQAANARLEASIIEVNDLAHKAEAANVLKGQFLANMSHEIRTPMNAITGLTYLLLQSELTSKQRDFLKKIELATKNLLVIINDILDNAKIEAGKLAVEYIEFSVSELLENLSATAFVLAENRDQLEIIFEISPDVPKHLIGDQLRLNQIINNLLSNAIKFTSIGNIVVKVAVEKAEPEQIWLGISVTDTGIGISSEQQARLFRPFEQGDASTTRQYGGTGLGLALTKNLVNLMGGSIRMESQYGVGSTFSVTIPFTKGVENANDSSGNSSTPPGIQNLKTLVVVDNPVFRKTLKRELISLGCQVTTTQSGATALKLLENGHVGGYYQLILMDWQLPGESGAETIQHIRTSKNTIHQPKIILLMNYSKTGRINILDDLNLDGILLKPITSLALIKAIEDCFVKVAVLPEKRLSQLALDNVALNKIRDAKVLLVEDNVMNQVVATQMLKLIGIKVEIASTGQEALAKISRQHYDLVLLDIQLPDIDGLEVARRVRALNIYAELPIVAMTAHARTGDAQNSLDAGMNDHLAKPIDPEHLLRAMVKWIKPSTSRKHFELSWRQTAAPTEPLVDFSMLAGVDGELGMARLGDDQTVYRKVLGKFYLEYRYLVAKIEAAWCANDLETISKIAHNIKGTAGNIGAVNLQSAASQLEEVLTKAVAGNARDLLNGFETELTSIINSLANFEAQEPLINPEIGGNANTHQELLLFLRALAAAVAASKPQPCRKIVAEITAVKWSKKVTRKIGLIKHAVDLFDFSDAGKLIEQLISELELNNETTSN